MVSEAAITAAITATITWRGGRKQRRWRLKVGILS
jgi:hypothetical protein